MMKDRQHARMDQIAFYAADDEQAARIKTIFDPGWAAQWVEDQPVVESHIPRLMADGQWQLSSYRLQFNYDLGIELEIITANGVSWHSGISHNGPFISHIGIHLADDDDEFPNLTGSARLVQHTRTLSHTNPAIIGRRYEYMIWEISRGTFIKYIKRTMVEGK